MERDRNRARRADGCGLGVCVGVSFIAGVIGLDHIAGEAYGLGLLWCCVAAVFGSLAYLHVLVLKEIDR